MTQTETIVWHKYPDEIPDRFDDYFIQTMHQGMEKFEIDEYCDDDYWYWHESETVIAWAELPKGWKDE